jgi:hypothetical protein
MVLAAVAGAFGLASIVLLGVAITEARKTLGLKRDGMRARATVRELRTSDLAIRSRDEPSTDDPVYAPVFEFSGPEGRLYRITGAASYPPRYAVGDEVTVLFPLTDPGQAKLETLSGLWLGVVLTAVGSVVTAAVAAAVLALSAGGG